MRVNGGNPVSYVANLYAEQAQAPKGRAPKGSDDAGKGVGRLDRQQDQVELSDQAKALLLAREALAQAPDVNQDKVAELKAQVQAGTYQVDSRVVAEKLLKSIVEVGE